MYTMLDMVTQPRVERLLPVYRRKHPSKPCVYWDVPDRKQGVTAYLVTGNMYTVSKMWLHVYAVLPTPINVVYTALLDSARVFRYCRRVY
jgi:hypothetical protein